MDGMLFGIGTGGGDGKQDNGKEDGEHFSEWENETGLALSVECIVLLDSGWQRALKNYACSGGMSRVFIPWYSGQCDLKIFLCFSRY